MEIVTFETAKKLKEAGFPQPEPNTGQFWYDKEGDILIVSEKKTDCGFFYGRYPNDSGIFATSCENEDIVYAPTVTDILRELGQKYVLWYDESPKIQIWFCAKTADLPQDAQQPFGHTNPAEAAALAWMDKNKNK